MKYVPRHLRRRRSKRDIYGHVVNGPCWCSGYLLASEQGDRPVWHGVHDYATLVKSRAA